MSVANSTDMNPLQQRMLQFRVIVHEALMLNCRLYEYLERRLHQLEARKIQQHQERTADTGCNKQSQSHYSDRYSSSPASTGFYSSSASPHSPCSPFQHSTFNEQNTSRTYQSQRPLSLRKDVPLTPSGVYVAGGGPQPLTSTPYHYQLDSFRTPIKTTRKENSYENGCSTGCQRISCPNCKSEFQIEFTVKKLSEK